MSNISAYSQTAASNNATPPNGWPEGQSPSSVNDCAREMMAGIAKWYAHLDNSLTTTGSGNAYVLTTGSSHAALADIGVVTFKANHSSTGAATLAVDGLASKAIRWNGAAIIAGSIVSGNTYVVAYNATNDVYDLLVNPVDLPSLKSRGITYPTTDGTSGQYMTTNGAGVLSFASASQNLTRSARTSDTILAAGDKATLIDVTSGTFTQTITAAATLGAGWYCFYRNSGSGDITLDPNASETIDGLASFIVYPGECRMIICDGSAFYSQIVSAFRKSFASSANFVKPPGYVSFDVAALAAGGGGGGGSWDGGATGNDSGGSGGGGGALRRQYVLASAVAASEVVTIGAGGAGGNGRTGSEGEGSAGTAGGSTSLGSLIISYGGGGGGGARPGSNPGIGGAGGLLSIGGTGTLGSPATGDGIYAASGAAGSVSVSPAAGGGSALGGPGGGAGGGIISAAATAGSAGGSQSAATGGGGGGGAATGAAGSSGSGFQGGGGGGANTSGVGGVGGAGGIGGGGGGGGSATGNAGGNGGAGGNGQLEIWGIA